MKISLKGCLMTILIIIGSIVVFFVVRQSVVYLWSQKIDVKIDDSAYSQSLAEELVLQNRQRSNINNETVHIKDSTLTEEPKQFYLLNEEQWVTNFSIDKLENIKAQIHVPDKYYDEINNHDYDLPDISHENNQIHVKHNEEQYSFDVDGETLDLTHFNETSAVLDDFFNFEQAPYFISYSNGIQAFPLTESSLADHQKIEEFEQLLLTKPMITDKESRFLPFIGSTVWDREQKEFHSIHQDDLISQDGQTVMLDYDKNDEVNFSLQSIEDYVQGSNEIETVKIPKAAIKKRSSFDGWFGIRSPDIISFTSDRIVFELDLPAPFWGFVGTMTLTVDLTENKPKFTIIQEEEI